MSLAHVADATRKQADEAAKTLPPGLLEALNAAIDAGDFLMPACSLDLDPVDLQETPQRVLSWAATLMAGAILHAAGTVAAELRLQRCARADASADQIASSAASEVPR